MAKGEITVAGVVLTPADQEIAVKLLDHPYETTQQGIATLTGVEYEATRKRLAAFRRRTQCSSIRDLQAWIWRNHNELQESLGLATSQPRAEAVHRIWGLSAESTVDIVCSEIPPEEQPYFADPKDRNYLRYAKFADLDSLIYVRTHLAGLYPLALARDFSPSEYFDTNAQRLVVIGGPPWNAKFREFQSTLPFEFLARPLGEDDPLRLNFKDALTGPTWSRDGRLLKDVSVFVRLSLGASRVFLMGGCLTLGVLGAAAVFLDPAARDSNARFICDAVADNDFILVWETEKVGGFCRPSNLSNEPPLALLRRGPRDRFDVVLDNLETS